MRAPRMGIIGGSGLYRMEGLTELQELHLDTPYGPCSDALVQGLLGGVPVVFLPAMAATII
jgi:5'-methylthioadenosine phosphorylase